MRLHAQSAAIENGFVWLPNGLRCGKNGVFPMGRHEGRLDLAGAGLGEAAPADDGMIHSWAGR
jgi:hypothetical protein